MDEYYPPTGTESPAPLADSAERINRFTGTYQFTRLAYTKGGKLKGLFSTASVQPGSDAELVITMAGNTDSQRLVEVAPLYFEEIEGDGRLVFHEDDDGDIAYQVNLASASADGAYQGLDAQVAVTNDDDDEVGANVAEHRVEVGQDRRLRAHHRPRAFGA